MKEVRYSPVNLLRVAQSFPATPRIMARLGPLLGNPNTTLEEVAALLKHDGSLAARLLRIANSAAFAQSEPVASVENAAVLIGLQEVHRLVGAVAVDPFSCRDYPLYGFSGPRLRDNALLVALLMEELAQPAEEDSSAAYVAGLVRSLGKLALVKIADEHAPIAAFQHTDLMGLVGWEKRTFGVSSNEATVTILKEWRFPGVVTQAIADHYAPANKSHKLSCLLNLAAGLADQAGHGLPGESAYWAGSGALVPTCGLRARHLEQAMERAVTAFDRINRALG